ncbi:hypothetical protein [Kitasatospora sp. NPDC056531]|uniref:hypothetical protein n=1 Tax=Kitasatospora sp. NPDC056531 TaxID=3345856 RepID=UPI003699D5E1
MPFEFAATPTGMDLAIAECAADRTTDTVQRLTGRPPQVVGVHLLQRQPHPPGVH